MKYTFGYLEMLLKQCAGIKTVFEKKEGNYSIGSEYSEICKHLTKDFLPPIEREDIAAISYSLLEIGRRAVDYCFFGEEITPELKEQTEALPKLVSAVMEKKQACDDDIRRLVDVNFKCGNSFENSDNKYGRLLNNSLRDFLLAIQTAYFKNL